MSSECVWEVLAQNTPEIFLYSMLKLSLFDFVSGPLNANELQLPTQWAELQECVCVNSSNYVMQTHAKMSETVLPFMFKPESDKDGETKK